MPRDTTAATVDSLLKQLENADATLLELERRLNRATSGEFLTPAFLRVFRMKIAAQRQRMEEFKSRVVVACSLEPERLRELDFHVSYQAGTVGRWDQMWRRASQLRVVLRLKDVKRFLLREDALDKFIGYASPAPAPDSSGHQPTAAPKARAFPREDTVKWAAIRLRLKGPHYCTFLDEHGLVFPKSGAATYVEAYRLSTRKHVPKTKETYRSWINKEKTRVARKLGANKSSDAEIMKVLRDPITHSFLASRPQLPTPFSPRD